MNAGFLVSGIGFESWKKIFKIISCYLEIINSAECKRIGGIEMKKKFIIGNRFCEAK